MSTNRLLTSCLVAGILAASVPIAGSQNKTTYIHSKAEPKDSSLPAAPMSMMPLVAPLFIENDRLTSVLFLVNGSAVNVQVQIAVRGLDGTTLASQTVQLMGHSEQQVGIKSLLSSSRITKATSGSITVMQEPALSGYVMAAALSMTDASSSPISSVIEELAMPSTESSPVLEAVAESTSNPVLAITSLVATRQHVTIRCLGKDGLSQSRTVVLGPQKTVLERACSASDDLGEAGAFLDAPLATVASATGIMLTSDGSSGSFAAYSIAQRVNSGRGSLSSVAFTDPAMLMSATTVFAGVPVGSSERLTTGLYIPTLALSNFSSRLAHVTIRYATSIGSEQRVQDLRIIDVPATTTRQISFPDLSGASNLQNSFVISSDGSPGDVTTSLSSNAGPGSTDVQILGKDQADSNNGGNHPWSLGKGTDSVLLLFNTSQKPQYFNVYITSGSVTWQKSYQLQPAETRAIDIGTIVQTGVTDRKGATLPKEATGGQIGWYTPNRHNGSGRLMLVNDTTGLAESFSCGIVIELCEASFGGSSYIANGSNGYLGTIDTQVCTNTCSGEPVGPGGDGYSYYWEAQQPSTTDTYGDTSGADINVIGVTAGYGSLESIVSDGYCSVTQYPEADSCDFSIGPTTTNGSCSGSQNNYIFSATISPSPSACPYAPSYSSCSGGSPTTGTISLGAAPNPTCSMTNMFGYPMGTEAYYAGPGTSGQNTGSFTVGFHINFGSQGSVDHSTAVTVKCQ